ncbi:MAG: acyltransferase [Acidobacteria bacterium]|nr:acyltransferase [Acidobacteriota bacterium]
MRITRLDGIRALAIGFVFLHHAGIFPPGWMGVDLFFVLSGYLITGILRRARNDSSFWKPFYIKRATRILPPLIWCFLGTTLVCSSAWRKWGLYYLLFAADVAVAIRPEAACALGVLWSLAVEEHFYFIWPFAVRLLNKSQLIRILIAVIVLEPILRAIFTPIVRSHMWFIYSFSLFRFDSLAAGSLLALFLEEPRAKSVLHKWAYKTFIVSTLVLIAGLSSPVFRRGANSILFNSLGYSLVTLCAVSFVAYVLIKDGSILSRFLSSRPFVFLGTISYGFYLVHYIFVLLIAGIAPKIGIRSALLSDLIAFVFSVVFSALSFYLYEGPINKWGHRTAKKVLARSVSDSSVVIPS